MMVQPLRLALWRGGVLRRALFARPVAESPEAVAVCWRADDVSARSFGSLSLRKDRFKLGIKLWHRRRQSDREFEAENPENVEYTKRIKQLARQGRWDDARSVFEEIPVKNTIVYSCMMHASEVCRQYQYGLNLFKEMEDKGVERNGPAYGAVLSILSHQGDYASARRLWNEMVDTDKDPDHPSCVTALANAAAVVGDVEVARRDVEEAKLRGVQLNQAHYGCVIKAYERVGDPRGALQVLEKMRADGVPPTVVQYTMVVGACNGALSVGELSRADRQSILSEVHSAMAAEGVAANRYFVENHLRLLLGGHCLAEVASLVESGRVDKEDVETAWAVLQKAQQDGVPLSTLLKRATAALQEACSVQDGEDGVLPAGWRQTLDDDSGRLYYWMEADPTGTTTWERPV